MSRQALLLEAHHTTHIEGTQLTLEESARLCFSFVSREWPDVFNAAERTEGAIAA